MKFWRRTYVKKDKRSVTVNNISQIPVISEVFRLLDSSLPLVNFLVVVFAASLFGLIVWSDMRSLRLGMG